MNRTIKLQYAIAALCISILLINGCATTKTYTKTETLISEQADSKIASSVEEESIFRNYLQQSNGKVIFLYDDSSAGEIYLVGEFNNWKKNDIPMTLNEAGVFSAEIDIEPGKYLYKFIVDGNWITDPNNPVTSPDGYGGQNSVLVVE
ncbi:glycogen-binding domain-containing protein [Elusimicrobiota bacterium]